MSFEPFHGFPKLQGSMAGPLLEKGITMSRARSSRGRFLIGFLADGIDPTRANRDRTYLLTEYCANCGK